MAEFLNIALGFPTAIWTGLLALLSAYWLFVIVGALDLEFLDAQLPDLDLEFDIDVDVDVDADIDGPDGAPVSPFAKIAVALGIGKVPVTILLSFFALSGWAMSYFGVLYLTPLLKFNAVSAFILGMTFVLAVPVMGALAHPLKGVFTMTTRHGGSELIGKTCEITTGSVTSKFGQARLDDGGAGLLLAVRSESDEQAFGRKSTALIIGYDKANEIYFVEPYEQFLPSDEDEDHAVELAARIEESVNATQEV